MNCELMKPNSNYIHDMIVLAKIVMNENGRETAYELDPMKIDSS